MGTIKPHAYIEARLEVPRHHADAVGNFIVENICSGLVLEEAEDSDATGIKFYVAVNESNDWRELLFTYLSHLVNSTMPHLPAVEERTIENIEWEQEYKKSVKPTHIGTDVVVRPPWCTVDSSIKYDIIIEPKMAFGTGNHETTRSCLQIIRERFKPGMRFLDVGCGSGVLSILADKMQASFIKAIDTDPDAIENCRENFVINNVTAPFEMLVGSSERCQGDPPYDFVCANIMKSTILSLLDRLSALTADNGILVLSGLLDRDEAEVSNKLRKIGHTAFSILRDNEWLTYTVPKG
jgi:ribosomal protein L11 methyltransferase